MELSALKLVKIKEHKQENAYDYCYDHYYDWALKDLSTGQEVVVEKNRIQYKGAPSLQMKHLEELCGKMTLNFYRDLFRDNPSIFNSITDIDPVIKFEVYGGEETEQKIAIARKKIRDAEREYKELVRTLYKKDTP